MRRYAKISPQLWIGDTGRQLREAGPEALLVALYLLSNPHANMLGLYYLPISLIAHETSLTSEGASKGLRRAIEAGFCVYDESSEMVFVHEMARYQIADQLLPTDKQCAGLQREYDALPNNPFLTAFYEKYKTAFHLTSRRDNWRPSEGASMPHRSQEQEQEQEQEASAANATVVDDSVDPRHGPVRELIQKLHLKNFRVRCQWDGSEAKGLDRLLSANPSWTEEQIFAMVRYRFDSEGIASDRPRKWLPNIGSYAAGPQDRFNKLKGVRGNGNGTGKVTGSAVDNHWEFLEEGDAP